MSKRFLATVLMLSLVLSAMTVWGAAAPDASAPDITTASESGDAAVEDGTPYFVAQEPRTSPAWVRKLPAAKDPNVDQLIVVAGIDKTTAYVTMHERDMNGDWMQIMATPGFVGKDGIGKANINDAYTPTGTFTIDCAFGIAEDPGCQMPYTQVDDSYYWSGDGRKGKHFNELVSLKDVPDLDKKESEHIIDVEYGYRYCLNMGYNAECKYKNGFAFFMHCFLPNRPYTGGCVAVPESVMKFVMQHVRPGCKITINTLKKMGGKLDD